MSAPENKATEAAASAATEAPAIPGIGPAPGDVPRPDPQPIPITRPPTSASARLFLGVTGAVLLCWFVWLSATALNKTREPIVSRAQAAVAPVPVRATLTADDKGAPKATVTVIEALKPEGPAKGATLVVTNVSTARGFSGEGEYLLLLAPEPLAFMPDGGAVYQLVALRTFAADTDPPAIYRWSADVESQAKKLYATKK